MTATWSYTSAYEYWKTNSVGQKNKVIYCPHPSWQRNRLASPCRGKTIPLFLWIEVVSSLLSHAKDTIPYCRKAYWRMAGSSVVQRALTKQRLIHWGFYDLATAYQSMHVNYWKRRIREPYARCCERTAVSHRLLDYLTEKSWLNKPINNFTISSAVRWMSSQIHWRASA